MPVSPNSRYETVSLVLTKYQAEKLRSLAQTISTEHRRVSISEVGRIVIGRGLPVIFDAANTSFDTTIAPLHDASIA